MVTIISRFRVRNGLEGEVRQAFIQRPHLVDHAPGFCGLEVLTDAQDPSVFLLVTRWTNEESFRNWHHSESHHESHVLIPKGLKLDASYTSLTVAHSIEEPRPIQSALDAIGTQTGALSGWLMESDTVFLLLLAPDGMIMDRNRAGQRIFPVDSSMQSPLKIWDCLVCADAEHMRQRLRDQETSTRTSFLLNWADGVQNPVTLEVCLLRCRENFLLVGTEQHQDDSIVKNEMIKIANELSIAMRGAAQKNRELQEAKETIDLLARTDSLTGLANRRMLEETLPRETARAHRLREDLSAVFVDVDHFKPINDQSGHKTGDEVLARIGGILKTQIRSYALGARCGGDEFLLLLPGTSKDAALLIAERIREKVATIRISDCHLPITISLGVASLNEKESGKELVARADEALYNAKKKGGNTVESI